jgi:hypothetical protein
VGHAIRERIDVLRHSMGGYRGYELAPLVSNYFAAAAIGRMGISEDYYSIVTEPSVRPRQPPRSATASGQFSRTKVRKLTTGCEKKISLSTTSS